MRISCQPSKVTANQVLHSLAETACNSFVQKLMLDLFAKFSSLVCQEFPKLFLAVWQP